MQSLRERRFDIQRTLFAEVGVIWRSALSLASRDRLSILIFHRVLRESDPILPSEPSAKQFEAMVRHLVNRFNVLPLSQAVDRLFNGTLPPGSLAITFDDGYTDNLSVAAPILQRFGVSATVFVATEYLDGGCMWNDLVIEAFRSTRLSELDLTDAGVGRHAAGTIDARRVAIDRVLEAIKYLPSAQRVERARMIAKSAKVSVPIDLMLTRKSVGSLIEFGFEIGAHTVSHPILARIPASDAWREISESKQDLEGLLDRGVTLFAYPNGQPYRDYTHEHVRMVREAGFAAALSTARGAASPKSDILQLPRFTPWSRHPMKFDLLMLRNLCKGVEAQAA